MMARADGLKIIYYPEHGGHDPAGLHPYQPHFPTYYAEVAERGRLIHQAVQEANLGPLITPEDFGRPPILAVHTPDLVTLLETAYTTLAKIEGRSRPVIPDTFLLHQSPRYRPHSLYGQLGHHCFDTSSPIFEQSWNAAYWSTQTALTAASRVFVEGGVAYALCRPPGHHASANVYGGFCYLNNVAIAANWLTQAHKRVAIVDVDYHHGNGTQAIFYERDDVFFCSLHVHPDFDYPYYWGYADEVGSGRGQGHNLNLPLPLATNEESYLETLHRALLRVAAYQPDYLFISLGLDTAEGDPVGGFCLQTESFAKMGRVFADLRLPTIIVQEGGYLLPTLGQNVVAFLSAWKVNEGDGPIVKPFSEIV